MTIVPIVAERDMHCFRCTMLGITDPTIMAGDACLEVREQNRRDHACVDCFARLQEALAKL